MKTLVLAVVVLSSAAMAQAIGGTMTATYLNSDNGSPSVQIDVNLTCSLTCDSSAPIKHFGIVGGIRSWYASASTEHGDYTAFLTDDLDLDGQASAVSPSFKPGQTVFLKAQSVTCLCGGRTGEGGYIDLLTPNLVIPAYIVPLFGDARVGDDVYFNSRADLRGSEQVELKIEGGGLSQSKVFAVSDLTQQGYATWVINFTQAGTATATAKLLPSGVTSTATWNVTAGSSSTGGGGGSSGTGGGSGGGGGGGGSSEPSSCSALGGESLLLLALALMRRR